MHMHLLIVNGCVQSEDELHEKNTKLLNNTFVYKFSSGAYDNCLIFEKKYFYRIFKYLIQALFLYI